MKVGGFALHRNAKQIINVHISLLPRILGFSKPSKLCGAID
jgi:hypothetical protein